MLTEQLLENPFVYLPMTFDPKNFYGSTKLVEFILKTVSSAQTIAPIELLALPGMGKSTLLRYLSHPEGALYANREVLLPPFREKPQRLFPVHVEFRLSPSDMHPFLYLYEQLRKEYPKYKDRVQSEVNLNLELPDFKEHSKPKEPDEAVDLLEQEIKELSERGIRLILLLDDFDLAFKRLDLAQTTRLRPMRDFVAFVMALEQPLHIVNPEAAGSPFFQNTPLIRMGALPLAEAKRFIESPAEEAGKPFSDEQVNVVLKYTGGHPYLTILGGKALWEIRELMAATKERNMAFTTNVLQLLIGQLEEEFRGPFQLYWERLEHNEQDTLKILSADNKQQNLQRIHYKALPILLEIGLVKYTLNGVYELFSPLFKSFVENASETSLDGSARQDALHTIQTLHLSGLEASLYDYLRNNRDRFCTYTELWQSVWQSPTEDLAIEQIRRRLQVTVSRLRSKLEQTREDIFSVRELGYKLVSYTDS
jgi:hypothetical protein